MSLSDSALRAAIGFRSCDVARLATGPRYDARTRLLLEGPIVATLLRLATPNVLGGVARGAWFGPIDWRRKTLDEATAELGSGVLAIQADVAEVEAMERAVAAAVKTFGPLDIVFANAGVGGATPIGQTSLAGAGCGHGFRTRSPAIAQNRTSTSATMACCAGTTITSRWRAGFRRRNMSMTCWRWRGSAFRRSAGPTCVGLTCSRSATG